MGGRPSQLRRQAATGPFSKLPRFSRTRKDFGRGCVHFQEMSGRRIRNYFVPPHAQYPRRPPWSARPKSANPKLSHRYTHAGRANKKAWAGISPAQAFYLQAVALSPPFGERATSKRII